ncbi:hypothetical protein [Streptomyces sp. NPDC059649]|uniref:hypothetical protein n=1 Tax=Streptomyces sp. NPDC059649 TaxID=3346895 RepID=UPI0036AEFF8E
MGTDSHTWATHAHKQTADLQALEQQATHTATAPLAAAIAAAQRAATTQWLTITSAVRTTPGADAIRRLLQRIRELLAGAFRGQGAHAQQAIQEAALAAVQFGAAQAARIGTLIGGSPPPTSPVLEPGPQAQAVTEGVTKAIDNEHHAALALLTTAAITAGGLAGVTAVFRRARRAVARVANAAAVAVTSAAAAGAAAVARAFGPHMLLLWVAEVDACPACRAYAGRTTRPGKPFPGGLTLDPRTVFPSPIVGPPRHPHCRCVVIPWRSDWQTGGTPLPLLLRQRAQTARRI